MNNKFLILALLTLLSGCATTDSPTLATGIGSGAVASSPSSTSKKFSESSVSSQSSTSSAKVSPRLNTPVVTETNEFETGADDANTEVINADPARSYSRYKTKASKAIATERGYQPITHHRNSDDNVKTVHARPVFVEHSTPTTHQKNVTVEQNKNAIYLQLGVFSKEENARTLQHKMAKNQMPTPTIKEVRIGGKLSYRVQVGPLPSTAKAHEITTKLTKMGVAGAWYVTNNKL